LRAVARRRRLDTGDVAIHSKVLVLAGDDKSYELAVVLAVSLPSVADSDEAADLVRVAHGLCPYSNAINVALSANGRDVEPRSD